MTPPVTGWLNRLGVPPEAPPVVWERLRAAVARGDLKPLPDDRTGVKCGWGTCRRTARCLKREGGAWRPACVRCACYVPPVSPP